MRLMHLRAAGTSEEAMNGYWSDYHIDIDRMVYMCSIVVGRGDHKVEVTEILLEHTTIYAQADAHSIHMKILFD